MLNLKFRGLKLNKFGGSIMAFIFVWLFLVVGWCLNLFQVIKGYSSVETFGEIAPAVIIKTVALFMGPVASVWGWIDLFGGAV